MFSVLCGCSVILLWVCVVIFLCDGRVLTGGSRSGVPWWKTIRVLVRSRVYGCGCVGVGVFGSFVSDTLELLRLCVYWSLIW